MAELVEATSTQAKDERLAALIWGDAGTFKTTLAATGRGNKLWLSFDDGAIKSVKGLKNILEKSHPQLNTALKSKIYELDMAAEDKVTYVGKFEGIDSNDPLGLTKYFTDSEKAIKTLVVDSLTTLGDDVIEYAVKYKGYNKATLTNPGQQAYGARLTLLKLFVTNLLKLTAKYNIDIIFISHAKDKYDEDTLVAISLALGGNVANEIGLKFGEIWFVQDTSTKGRLIHFAPFLKYTPMKTRMFNKSAGKPTNIEWKYDINNPDPKYEIATMFDTWEQSGYQKIEVPK